MGRKKLLSHRARDRIRQFDEENSPTFMPTISVVRRIIIDGEAAEEYQAKLKEKLEEKLRKSRGKHYRVLDPNTLCLRLVDNAPVEPRHARDIAYALDHRLGGLIDRSPQFMSLPVGQVACFSEANPARRLRRKNIVGVVPPGWRGPSRRYETHDGRGVPTPMGLLVGESQICTNILGDVVKTPYAPIVVNSLDIPRHELMLVEEAAYETLPSEGFEWQDPQIILRTGRSWREEEVIDVRASVYDLAA